MVISTSRSLVSEVLAYLGGIRTASRAASLYGRALKLQKKGRHPDAFALIGEALALLPDTVDVDNASSDAVISSCLVMTVDYADLAAQLGMPRAADDAIRK